MKALLSVISILFMLMFLLGAVALSLDSDSQTLVVIVLLVLAFMYLLSAMGVASSPKVTMVVYAITTVFYVLSGIFYWISSGFSWLPISIYAVVAAINGVAWRLSISVLREFRAAQDGEI